MKNWYLYAKNNEIINYMFDENVEFSKFELDSIYLSPGLTIELTLRSLQLPDKYPDKWIKQHYNSFTINIHFYRVTRSKIENWNIGNILTPTISCINGHICFELTESLTNIVIESKFMEIGNIKGCYDPRLDE